jgi:glycosyltransferase involved in cell wall biosynthesis
VRIAIVGTELCAVDRHGGGLERVLWRWAAELVGRHEVVVVSHGGDGAMGGAERAPFDVVTVERPGELGDALARLRPDVVSLHNRPQWAGRCGSAAVAVTFHNYPVAWRVGRRSVGGVRTAAPTMALSAVSGALAAAAGDWLGVGAGAVAVTPPSIDPVYLAPPPRRPEAVVLSPNRLLRKKGVLDLLAVAAMFPDVTFAFADLISPWTAPTAEHRALRRAVSAVPNAALFAPAGPAALAGRYATSAAVACPVREPEGLGLVALEAQACGVPLVTTDMGGLREATFAPNRCIPPADRCALAAALREAIDRRSGGEGPSRRVAARHSPEASAAVYEAWLLDALRLR